MRIGVLVFLLCAACVQDIKTWKISNFWVLAVALWGICMQACQNGGPGVTQYIFVCGIYLAALFPLYRLGMIGAGDVKLLAVLQGSLGWQASLIYLICVLAVAGGIALIKLSWEQNLRERLGYFFSYVRDVALTGQWRLYLPDQEKSDRKSRYIHMTIPMLAGLLIYMGGTR